MGSLPPKSCQHAGDLRYNQAEDERPHLRQLTRNPIRIRFKYKYADVRTGNQNRLRYRASVRSEMRLLGFKPHAHQPLAISGQTRCLTEPKRFNKPLHDPEGRQASPCHPTCSTGFRLLVERF